MRFKEFVLRFKMGGDFMATKGDAANVLSRVARVMHDYAATRGEVRDTEGEVIGSWELVREGSDE